jgi:hypothetical protein
MGEEVAIEKNLAVHRIMQDEEDHAGVSPYMNGNVGCRNAHRPLKGENGESSVQDKNSLDFLLVKERKSDPGPFFDKTIVAAALPPRKRLKTSSLTNSQPGSPTTPSTSRPSKASIEFLLTESKDEAGEEQEVHTDQETSGDASEESNEEVSIQGKKRKKLTRKDQEVVYSQLPPRKAKLAVYTNTQGNNSKSETQKNRAKPEANTSTKGRLGRKQTRNGKSKKPTKRKGNKSDDDDSLYCICRRPYNADLFMIACDSCDDWFHGKCVGITERKAKKLETYVCPKCTKQKSKKRITNNNEDEDDDVKKTTGGSNRKDNKYRNQKNEGTTKDRRRRAATGGKPKNGNRFHEDEHEVSDEEEEEEEKGEDVSVSRVDRGRGETKNKEEDKMRRCLNERCGRTAKPNSKYCSTECGLLVAKLKLQRQQIQSEVTANSVSASDEDGSEDADPERENTNTRPPSVSPPMRSPSSFASPPLPSPNSEGFNSGSVASLDVQDFSPLKRSLTSSAEALSASDDADLKQLELLENQKREVELNLHHLELRRQNFEKSIEFSLTLVVSQEETKKLSSAKAGEFGPKSGAMDTMDCYTCGQPIPAKNFSRHLEQCFVKKEKEGNAFLSSHKVNDRVTENGVTIAYCNYYDARTGSYCTRLLESCPYHAQKKRAKRNQLCGCPTSDFESGYCERLKKACVKHFNWENIGKLEMAQEQQRQLQLLSNLLSEINLVKARIKRRNLANDDQHRTIAES